MQNSIRILKSGRLAELNNSTNLLPKDNLILTGNGAEEPKYYCKMFKKTLIRIICIIKFISCLPAGLAVPKIMEQILESVWKMTQSHLNISPVKNKSIVLIGMKRCKVLGFLTLAKCRVKKNIFTYYIRQAKILCSLDFSLYPLWTIHKRNSVTLMLPCRIMKTQQAFIIWAGTTSVLRVTCFKKAW